jgi:hypothetical protein
VTFDEALAALLALVGERVDVHVFDASSTSHLVATFRGRLRAGYSMSGGHPARNEAIYLRLEAGDEGAGGVYLDREVFGDALRHDDGSITLKFGGVELSSPGAKRARLAPKPMGRGPGGRS